MTTDPRIAVLSALSSPDWHPVPEAHGMPWDEAEQLLAAYDASRAAPVVPSAPTDRAAVLLRDVASYLSALHGSVARHDNLAANLGCAGCELRDQIRAELRRMADEAQQPETQATPCDVPNPCEDGELCATHEEEQAHAEGEHEYCGPTCEVQFPSEQMRNFILAKGYPGTAGMLDELLRRAAAGQLPAVVSQPGKEA